MRRAWACGLLWLVCGCGPSLGTAQRAYHRGDYGEAQRTLTKLAPKAAQQSERERARYDLYAGLTALATGDRGRAQAHLRNAEAQQRRHPDTLGADDANRLQVAVNSLAALGAAP